MLVLILLFSFACSQNTCSSAIPVFVDNEQFDSGVVVFSNETTSTWNCYSSGDVKQSAVVYKLQSNKHGKFTVDSCFSETTISSRLIIGSECLNDVTTSCVGAEDISTPLCNGHRSKVRFDVNSTKTYYIMVTGVTSSEVGNFRLLIEKEKEIDNSNCLVPIGVSIPSIVNGQLGLNSNNKTIYERWYSFVPEKTTVFINTCNPYTDIHSMIIVYNAEDMKTERDCYEQRGIAGDSWGCGDKARLPLNVEIGKRYLIRMSSVDGIRSEEYNNFQMSISYEADAQTCEDSFHITSFPKTIFVDHSGLPSTTTSCGKTNNGFYAKIVGDGSKYLLSTCGSHSESDSDSITIELFEGSCNSCMDVEIKKCGFDNFVELTLGENKIYFVRIASISPRGKISFSVTKYEQKSNDQCSRANNIEIINNTYVSQSFTSFNKEASKTACNNQIQQFGSWYYIHSKEDFDLTVGVIPMNPSQYIGVLELQKSCEKECLIEHEGTDSLNYKVTGNNDFFIFASLKSISELKNSLGAFLFYTIGSKINTPYSAESPLVLESYPYTQVLHLSKKQLPLCPYEFNTEVVSAYVSIQPKKRMNYEFTTCGLETVSPMGLHQGPVLNNKPVCAMETKTGLCGNGNMVSENYEYNLTTNTGTPHCYFIYPLNLNANEESVRVNFYEPYASMPNDECVNAKVITESYEEYFNTMYSHSSKRICGENKDGLKGVWYLVKAQKPKKIYISTDDTTSFNTHIGIYKSCVSKIDESWPSECLAFGDYKNSPVGTRGTSVSYEMKKGDSAYVFVGSYNNKESGLGKISFILEENETNEEDDDNNVGLIVGMVFLGIFILIVIAVTVGAVVFFYTRKRSKYSDF